MCVCTLLTTNPMGGRVRAHAPKGKINFTQKNVHGAEAPKAEDTHQSMVEVELAMPVMSITRQAQGMIV